MRVLIGCEESQASCHEFLELGHDAWSCDIKPSSGEHPDRHIQGDLLEVINDGWDLAVFHPPCTYICNSGVTHLTDNPVRWEQLADACTFFTLLWNAPIDKIAIENPIPHKHGVALLPDTYDQKIQPYFFGHPESKATCLWLKNLPPLMPTLDVRMEMSRQTHAENNRMFYLSPGPERAELRSKTYKGIAMAMADQWGGEA